jgi:hypothetical protein
MRLSGKLTLYATKNCAEQLRMKHGVSISEPKTEQIGDIFLVTVTASLPDGRTDTDFGSVPTNGMSGEKLANCYLKAITKAKRRVTLSLLGLGMLDETEVATRRCSPRSRPCRSRHGPQPNKRRRSRRCTFHRPQWRR